MPFPFILEFVQYCRHLRPRHCAVGAEAAVVKAREDAHLAERAHVLRRPRLDCAAVGELERALGVALFGQATEHRHRLLAAHVGRGVEVELARAVGTALDDAERVHRLRAVQRPGCDLIRIGKRELHGGIILRRT